jgi:hypothetical protein
LKVNDFESAYNSLISLNDYDESIDESTKYFVVASVLKEAEPSIEYSDDTVLVEDAVGYFVRASVKDFEDTLEEIERKYLVSAI